MKRLLRLLDYIIPFLIFFIVSNKNISLDFKIYSVTVCLFIMIMQLITYVNWFMKWTREGFEICREAFKGYGDIIKDLAKIVELNPKLTEELIAEKNKREDNDALPTTLKDTNKKIADIEKLQDRIVNLEKNLSPFRISLYAILVSISVAVAVGIIGIMLLRIPLPK